MSERLNNLYRMADEFNEEIPYQLSKKIEIYTKILLEMGNYISHWTYKHGEAYAERKYQQGDQLANFKGKQQEKIGQAELRAKPYRIEESKAKSELVKWEKAYNSTVEQIQAMKKTLEVLLLDYRKGG